MSLRYNAEGLKVFAKSLLEKSGLPFEVINDAAGALISSGLLK